MITAKQAKEITKKEQGPSDIEILYVERSIIKEAKKGNYECTVEDLSLAMKLWLKNNHYELKNIPTYRNETIYKISWHDTLEEEKNEKEVKS